MKMHLNMSPAQWRPFCRGRDELILFMLLTELRRPCGLHRMANLLQTTYSNTISYGSKNFFLLFLIPISSQLFFEFHFTTCQHWFRSLQWRHNGHHGVSNHRPHGCLLNRLFMRKSKKTSKPGVTGLCEENSPVTGEFPAQGASNAENVSIWWRHHVTASLDLWHSSWTLS